MYEMTVDLASFAPPRPEQEMLLRALEGNQAEIDRFLVGAHRQPPGAGVLRRRATCCASSACAGSGRRCARRGRCAHERAGRNAHRRRLVRAAQAGDTAGLGALLERHRSRLHAIAVSMLGHGPQAEDAVQDTFVIALRRIGELRDPAAARAWLSAILVNVCRGAAAPARVASGLDAVRPAAAPTPPTQAIDDGALRDWVWTALDAAVRAAAPRGHAALLHGRELLRGDRRAVRRARRHGPQPPERGEAQARRGAARDRRRAARRSDGALAPRGARLGEAYAASSSATATSARLRRRADRPTSRTSCPTASSAAAATRYAEALARDFEDGVRSRVGQVIPGGEVAIVERGSTARPTSRCTARPRLTQIHFHPDGPTSRIVSHYARALVGLRPIAEIGAQFDPGRRHRRMRLSKSIWTFEAEDADTPHRAREAVRAFAAEQGADAHTLAGGRAVRLRGGQQRGRCTPTASSAAAGRSRSRRGGRTATSASTCATAAPALRRRQDSPGLGLGLPLIRQTALDARRPLPRGGRHRGR